MNLAPRNVLLFTLLLLLLIGVPITLSLVQKQQETRTHAAGGTTLSLIPEPGPSSSIQKTVGDSIPIDLMIDPGSNAVTFVKFQVKYDPTKLQPVANNSFTLNTLKFPTSIEGPIVGNDTVSQSVSVGSDPTKVIRTVTKVGTFNFKAIASTADTPTTVSFTTISQVLSSGPNDQAGENVLANVSPATISIVNIAGSPTPTDMPSPTTIPTPTDLPTPTLAPNETALNFTLLLHGIGAAGDNPNPTGNDLSNKNPLHPQRNITVQVLNSHDSIVATSDGSISYDQNDGEFHGQVTLGSTFPSGNYSVKIQSDRYLRRHVIGVQTITKSTINDISVTQLIAGDTNDDNVLNVLDYNALLDCGYGDVNPLPITNSNSFYAKPPCQIHTPAINVDLDDNGIVNSFDYNLFLRELSVQNGD
jgi:hypothetical protein